ncbi:hypothetical protein F385_840 [Pantoea agglomerans 299R]|nr:hypothetical protein F385_1942 [Pantoea agglomerans 299R]ELP25956.1 hypothetical protein F385_840 [Pantoea agglomerans 299R]
MFLLDWSNAIKQASVKRLARRAASLFTREVGLDALREELRLTVIGALEADDRKSF